MSSANLKLSDFTELLRDMVERVERLTFQTKSTKDLVAFIAKSTAELELTISTAHLEFEVSCLVTSALSQLTNLTRLVNDNLGGFLAQVAEVSFNMESTLNVLPSSFSAQTGFTSSIVRLKKICNEMREVSALLQASCRQQEKMVIDLKDLTGFA